VSRCAVMAWLFALLLCGFSRANAATDVSQDIRDVRQMKTWRTSRPNLTAGPAAAPYQVCGIENPDHYEVLRLDEQLAPQLSDSAATAQIAALDRRISRFLTGRGWTPIKLSGQRRGIPNLTRCFEKHETTVQIYKTTGRCTMNSPCKAYDGFAVVFYIPNNSGDNKSAQKP
jgi:hypothetical protein